MAVVCSKNTTPSFEVFQSSGFLDPNQQTSNIVTDAYAAFDEIADVVSKLGSLQNNFAIGEAPTESTYSPPVVPESREFSFSEPAEPTISAIPAILPYEPPDVPTLLDEGNYADPAPPVSAEFTAPTFVSPPTPDFADLTFTDPTAPSAVQIAEPSPFVMPTAPTFDETITLDLSGGPGAAPVYDLDAAPAVTMPEMPAAPTISEPAVPVISGLDIPEFEDLEPITLSVDLPTPDLPDITDTLDYTNELWTSANVDDMAEHMARVRGGDFAIGEDIFRQIFNRAMVQVRRESVAQERQGRRAWGRLGWDIPGGVALAAEREAAENVSRANSFHAMETAIKEATQKNDDFWKSIELGAQLEALYAEAHKAYQDRALRYAVAVIDASVAILNAYIARYNAQVAAARVAIEEARVQLESQRITLEQYRLRIEAAIARGESQKLELELYKAQWEGIDAAVRVYATQIEAVKANLDAQRILLESHNLNIQGYATRVDAWAKEWEGQRVKIQGEGLRVQQFDSYVRAYAADIQGFSAEVQGESARIGTGAEIMRAKVENAKLAQEQYRTEWQGVQAKIDALSRTIDADARVYESLSRNEQARVSSLVEIERVRQQAAAVDVDRFKAEWDGVVAMVEARTNINDSRVKLYEGLVRGAIAHVEGSARSAEVTAQAALADIQRYSAHWGGISSMAQATAAFVQADAALYRAQVDGAQTASTVGIENARLQLQWNQANQAGDIEEARLAVQQITDAARLAETAQIALGQIYAQLLAASWSSMSYSESVSKGLSYSISDRNSYSCSYATSTVAGAP
jgi:hypothetical protein